MPFPVPITTARTYLVKSIRAFFSFLVLEQVLMFIMTEASGAKYNFCINGSYSMIWCLGLSISNIPGISQKSNEEKVRSFFAFPFLGLSERSSP